MAAIFHDIFDACERFFLSPSSEFYWIYLVAAFSYALIVCLQATAPGASGLKQAFARVFDRRLYFHPSAVNDYKILVINMVLLTTAAAIGLTGAFAVADGFGQMLIGFFGPSPQLVPSLAAKIAFTAGTFMVSDASLFCFHWLEHRVPALWELHKVHHSAEVLTPLTGLRVHPLITVIGPVFTSLLPGITYGVFVYLYGSNAAPVTIFGANAFFVLYYTLLGGHLAHMQTPFMFPKVLRGIFYSPALHSIHHSDNPRHYDTNFGFVFSFWDRLLGTLYLPTPEERATLRFGLEPADRVEMLTIRQLYGTPLRNIFRMGLRAVRGGTGATAAGPAS